jgi:hypothetical protein
MLNIAKSPRNLFYWVFEEGYLFGNCIVWHIALRDSVVASWRNGFVVPSGLFTPYPVKAFPLSLIPAKLFKFCFRNLSGNRRSDFNRLNNFDFFFYWNLRGFPIFVPIPTPIIAEMIPMTIVCSYLVIFTVHQSTEFFYARLLGHKSESKSAFG